MSDAEALLWSVERDPRLSSTMGAIVVLDGSTDPTRLEASVTRLVAAVPRLRQRVVPAAGPLAPPMWVTDDAFDLAHHLRHVRLPEPGSLDQVCELAAQAIADPFDRSRPLWRFVLVGGLAGGRSAVVVTLHHAIADGTGALLMAQHLVELSADEPPADPIDLAEVFAADRLAEAADQPPSPLAEQLRRGAGLAARLLNEAAVVVADPARVPRLGASALDTARAVAAQVPGGRRHTSPLWARRSRNRRIELLALPLRAALDRARELGGSLNDLFVTAALEGAVRYHAHFDADPPELTASIVVSTRNGTEGQTANAFLPSTAVLPAARHLTPADRFAAVSRTLADTKDRVRDSPDVVGPLAGVAGLLPVSLTTGLAVDQVQRVDFATSNLRGIPVPVWLAGQAVRAVYPIGPVGGTAFNITLMSNGDQLHLGLNIDPTAVTDPPLLRRCVGEGFAVLGVDPPRARAPGGGRSVAFPPMTAPDPFPRQHARTRRFTLGLPRNATITDDGRVLFLRSRAGDDPETCLWVHDGDGTRLLVDPRDLGAADAELPPEERTRRERARESAGGIVSYSVDQAGQRAVFALAGQLFVVDVATGAARQLPAVDAVFDPRLDPTGRRVAYVSGRSLWMVDLDAGSRELAGEDDPDVSWGAAEFVAAEEMGRSRGHWWSPDGERLLATRVDVSAVERWWIGDPANPHQQPVAVRYPRAGTANATVQLFELGVDGARRRIDWSEGGRYEYLADVVWRPERPILLVRQTRDQRRVAVSALDEDGTVRDLRVIEDEHWVELVTGAPAWVGQRLVTVEDRGDARRVCLDGEPIGPDGLQVRSVVDAGVDAVVVTATDEPTELHVYRFGVDGGVERLSDAPGVHGAVAAGSTTWLTTASPDRGEVVVRVLRGGQAAATIESVAEEPVLRARPRFLRSRARAVRSTLVLPTGHDGASPLPVLCDPYGGPHALRAVKAHNAHLTSQWFAEQGFAVLVADGRGTPGRGPAWERAVHGDLAAPVLDDQLEALDDAAGELPFLDLGRVAIRGWSFGGYLAALAVLRRPDRFHAAIAGAPVTTWRLYDTHYTERYLGHPDDEPDAYDRTDLLTDAHLLRRPLLLVHGLADDNVVAAHTLRLSSALLAAGRPHEVLPLSGVTHMTPQEVVAENLLRLQLDFLRRALGLPGAGGSGPAPAGGLGGSGRPDRIGDGGSGVALDGTVGGG